MSDLRRRIEEILSEQDDKIRRFVPEEMWTVTAEFKVAGRVRTGFGIPSHFKPGKGIGPEFRGCAVPRSRAEEVAIEGAEAHWTSSKEDLQFRQIQRQKPLSMAELKLFARLRIGLEAPQTERASQRLYEGFKAVTFPMVCGTHDNLFRFPQGQDEVGELISNTLSDELAESLPHELRNWVIGARTHALSLIQKGSYREVVAPPGELGFIPTGKPLADSIGLIDRQVFGIILAHFVHCYLQPVERLYGFLRMVAKEGDMAFLIPVHGLKGVCCNSLIGASHPNCFDGANGINSNAINLNIMHGLTSGPLPMTTLRILHMLNVEAKNFDDRSVLQALKEIAVEEEVIFGKSTGISFRPLPGVEVGHYAVEGKQRRHRIWRLA